MIREQSLARHRSQPHIDLSAILVRKDKEPKVPRDEEAPGSYHTIKGSFGRYTDFPGVGGPSGPWGR